jgi:hypothetical protein
VGIDTSIELAISKSKKLPPKPVNFKVTNTLTGERVEMELPDICSISLKPKHHEQQND